MINTMLQTSIGDFYFDAVFRTEHSANMIITEHPVQTGAPIADHAYLEPEEITCEIGMTDVNGDGVSVQMYQQLRELMARREPFTLVTRLHSYNDMLISALSVPDDYTTMFALKAGIVFKQVRVVQVATVMVQQTVSGSKAETVSPSGGSSSRSTSQSTSDQQKNASVLYQAKAALTSKTTKPAIQCTEESKTLAAGNAPRVALNLSTGNLSNKIKALVAPGKR